ncbi:MAG: MaoC/PaaZ C-terminal domain-containing protein [Clostridia bacterium]
MNSYTLAELSVGMKEAFHIVLTKEMMLQFRAITGDNNPLHCDADYALANGQPEVVAYGLLTASFLSTLAGVYLPGKNSLIHSVEIKFAQPVYPGDELLLEGTVTEVNADYGFIVVRYRMTNQHEQCVLRGKMQIGVR